MATINEHGATAITLAEYMDRLRAAYLAIDPDWNIEPESPDGQKLAIDAELLANLDEAVIHAYHSVDPNSAVGQQLDRIAQFAAITRQAATPSTAIVTFQGVEGAQIPVGTQVRNAATDTLWATEEPVTIEGGSATVGVSCETPGPEPASVGALSVLASPISGVQSVTNEQAASLGRSRESDVLFRVRRNRSVAGPSNNQVESMYAGLANLDGVNRVRIYENDENVVDGNGLSPHSIAIFVDGGDVDELGQAIAVRKNPGCGLNASSDIPNKVQLGLTTPRGSPLTVTFFRPESVTGYVRVELVGSFPAGTEGEIRAAIVDYANAALFDAEGVGFNRTGFGIGDRVAAGALYTPVNRVIGENGYVASIKLGTDPSDIDQDLIDPGFNGLAVFDEESIEVVVL